jgi:hypothetical protein
MGGPWQKTPRWAAAGGIDILHGNANIVLPLKYIPFSSRLLYEYGLSSYYRRFLPITRMFGLVNNDGTVICENIRA